MKAILLPLLLISGLCFGQVQNTQPVDMKVEIGCISGGSGNFAFSAPVIDRLLTSYLGNSLRVKNSVISGHPSGTYIITADVIYPQGLGTVVLNLEEIEGKLYITSNSCTHECRALKSEVCIYKNEVLSVDPCVAVRCSCEEEGTSAITIGQTLGLQKAALMTRNITPGCE
ncbi:MAG: hypothetical protein V4616_01000 [Bacteroidota bacterium]